MVCIVLHHLSFAGRLGGKGASFLACLAPPGCLVKANVPGSQTSLRQIFLIEQVLRQVHHISLIKEEVG